METIALGDHGPAIIEIRAMLQSLRLLPSGEAAVRHSDPAASVFDSSCVLATRQFQQERGLLATGRVDPDTYHELVDAGYRLGDRPLHHEGVRMLRGDDVRALQHQLSELGFHQHTVDGVFGPDTDASLRAFQADYGLAPDGVCGSLTTAALSNLLPRVVGGSASLLRSRARRRISGPLLAGRHVFLAVDDECFTWNVADRMRSLLELMGANATLEKPAGLERDPTECAEQANRSGAELFVALRVSRHPADRAEGAATFYFGSPAHVSTVGREIAGYMHRELVARTSFVDLGVHPRVADILRLTRMPAVLLEIGHATNRGDRERMADQSVSASAAEGLVAAVQRLYLDAPDEYPTGTWQIPAYE